VLQNEPEPLVSGERPTRAVPSTVRKSLAALRRVTGRGESTRVAPRGVAAKWSARGRSFRSRVVAFQKMRIRPSVADSAALSGVVAGMYVGRSGDTWACLSGPEGKDSSRD
jgi:hypothetical protein